MLILWLGGTTLADALANTGLAMFNYMTPLAGLTINTTLDRCFFCATKDSALEMHCLNISMCTQYLRGSAMAQNVRS